MERSFVKYIKIVCAKKLKSLKVKLFEIVTSQVEVMNKICIIIEIQMFEMKFIFTIGLFCNSIVFKF